MLKVLEVINDLWTKKRLFKKIWPQLADSLLLFHVSNSLISNSSFAFCSGLNFKVQWHCR